MYESPISNIEILHLYFRWWCRYLCLGETDGNSYLSTTQEEQTVVGFDHEAAIKRNLPIVSAITALDLPNGSSILLVVHEFIYNEVSNHSLLSELQLREFGIIY